MAAGCEDHVVVEHFGGRWWCDNCGEPRPIFVLACKNGHERYVSRDAAKRLNLTACEVCWKPLFVQAVRA